MTRHVGPVSFGALLTIVVLAGCGGGGGGGGGSVIPTTSPSGITGGVTPTPTPTPHIVEYPILTGNVSPADIVTGPDGALWFTEASAPSIGRITTSGVITQYPVANSTGQYSITLGPDNALWFTDTAGFIGRMDASGTVTNEFQVGASVNTLGGITVGADGNVWYVGLNSVNKILANGSSSHYTLPSLGGAPTYVVGGSDGALWVTEPNNGKIARVPTNGAGIIEYALPTTASSSSGPIQPGPIGIAAGPDGNLWVADRATPAIDRITTSGSITVFSVPGSFTSGPLEITPNPDGSLYYSEISGFGDRIGRISTAGTVTAEFRLPQGGGPEGITSGSDGNVWFAETGGNRIGKLVLH